MSRTVDNSFTKLDENLNLDPFVRQKAQNMHNTIRDDLTKAGLIAGSFLQGSFARRTMLKPLKDVDIVCLLPAYMWEALRGPHGPGTAMESFKPPIVERWPDVQFDVGDEPAGKALRVTVPGVDFTIDLVPAFDQEDDYVLIGDRFEGTWEPSNTRIQLKKVSDRNQVTGGRFVHQVREAKELTKQHEELKFVSGIVVESLAYSVIGHRMPDKVAIALFLDHAKEAVKGPVPEPAGEDDVTAKWTSEERQIAARVYAQASSKAAEALAFERAGEMDVAIDVWHSLFGDAFPAAPHRSVQNALTALAGRQPVQHGSAERHPGGAAGVRARSLVGAQPTDLRRPGRRYGDGLREPGRVTLGLAEVLEDPARVRRVLQDDLFGVAVDRVLEPRYAGVVLDMSFTPLPELSVAGYEGERGRVSIRPDGAIYSFPMGPERTWHHRYPSPLGAGFAHLAGQLCLWYPKDPRYLRWEWDDGLEQYVTRVYRHLFYEEYYRREGQWPVEDAPHDDPVTGAHPICSAFMREEEHRWAS